MLFGWFRPRVWRVFPAAPHHAASIAVIHAEGFARGWSPAEIEAMLADRTVVADVLCSASSNRRIDGFALSRLVADEAEILSIAVTLRRRGHGGSSFLLARHMARLQAMGARRIVLEVDEANLPALGLYDGFGFEEVGRRTGYYARADGTRGTALLLARPLG